MNFTTIYAETITLWPNEIDISDGRNLDRDGGYFPYLSEQWSKAEKQAEDLSDWHKLMVWAIFSELHQQAIEACEKGDKELVIADCDLQNIERIFVENLFDIDAGYSAELRANYLNDLGDL